MGEGGWYACRRVPHGRRWRYVALLGQPRSGFAEIGEVMQFLARTGRIVRAAGPEPRWLGWGTEFFACQANKCDRGALRDG